MNTKFKLDRQVVLTLCVLLTAVWLPLTTLAQDLPNTGDPAQGINVRDCQHSHDSLAFLPGSSNGTAEKGVGFSETDPAVHGAMDYLTTPQPTGVRMQQAFVGFAETDPADQSTVYDWAITKTPADRVQLASVGFAETDPTDNTYRPAVEIQNQHLVVCPQGHVKSVVYTEPGFPGLAVN